MCAVDLKLSVDFISNIPLTLPSISAFSQLKEPITTPVLPITTFEGVFIFPSIIPSILK